MSKKKDTKTIKDKLEATDYSEQYKSSFDEISLIRDTWEAKEALLLGKSLDSQSKETKSQVFIPELANIVIERAARVMAQNPTGKVQTLSKNDVGKNLMMNQILQNYVIPNANSYRPILIKSRMWNLYSNVYGSYAVLVDYMIRDDYVGPDFMLIPIRNIVPQSGKTSIQDCDYVFVRSVVSKKWLLSRDQKHWKNIDKLVKNSSKKIDDTDTKSFVDNEFSREELFDAQKDNNQSIEIITKYEKDRWITFSKDLDIIIRDIENPQKNNKIPIVIKDAFPLIDRFFGLGEFERGQSLNYAVNSLVNLYMDGVGMSIFPPLKIDLSKVVSKSIKYEAAAKWVIKEGQMNAIQEMQMSPKGASTFQSTYAFLKGAILNLAGTTDTTVQQKFDPGMGKTPQALKMQAAREASRDNMDRFFMEQALEEVYDRFIDLLSVRQEKPIEMYLSEEDLKSIENVHPDVVEMFESGKYGKLTIKPKDIKESKYKFYIDSGSTIKQDEQIENQTLTSILELMMKNPQIREEMKQKGKDIDFAELFKRWIVTSGIKDWDKILVDFENKIDNSKPPEGGMNLGEQPNIPPQVMPPEGMAQQPPMRQAPNINMEQFGNLSPEAMSIMQELKQ